jgi:hypothetical protein
MAIDGTNPGTNPEITKSPEEEAVVPEELARRRAVRQATDDADGAHMGGAGAQGGAVDFGNPKNFGT